MHGIVFWSANDTQNVSRLFTWENQFCSKEFLAVHFDSTVSTGYGVATLLYLAVNQPEQIETYDRCGTIMDYIVHCLSDFIEPYTVMTPQNAEAFGLYAEMKMLPKLCEKFIQTIKIQCPRRFLFSKVLPGLADHQCSIYRNETDKCIFMNIGTSAQLSFIETADSRIDLLAKYPSHISVRPFFEERKFLITAASLNGGNVLADFANMFVQVSGLDKNEVFTKLNELYDDVNLVVDPRLNSERHLDVTGSILAVIGIIQRFYILREAYINFEISFIWLILMTV